MAGLRARLARLWRFAKAVMRHPRMPRWLSVSLGVVLLIPGPVDEVVVIFVLLIVAAIRWEIVRESWEASA